MAQIREQVSLVSCASTSDDATVVRRTEEAIARLRGYDAPLRNARKIAVKVNAGVSNLVLTDGKQTELTDPAVVEGVIRAIRSVTDTQIVLGDAPTHETGDGIYHRLGYFERLAPYGNIRILNFGDDDTVETPTRNPGALMSRYAIPRELADADAFISIAKMKAHGSVGCTLSIKNLFGWLPPRVYGAPRNYLHDRLIRLPRVLADLAALWRPCLNVVDGIVATNMSEWNGTALRPNVILAGTNCLAVDSVGMRVMGFSPYADYPEHPFHYRRNPVKLAADLGVGPIDPKEIEVLGPAPEEVCVPFEVHRYGGATHRDEQLRRGAACVERYREQQEALAEQYAGQYLALDDGVVQWAGADMPTMRRLERESGRDWQHMPQFVIRCLPPSEEVERLDWYRYEADRLPDSAALCD